MQTDLIVDLWGRVCLRTLYSVVAEARCSYKNEMENVREDKTQGRL